ncbi:NAD(P)-dependent alcohol dehydrogenase [Bacillaceae bacterium SIJ1]|uniref:NAD(P)-dependent alcohol dehydrogenase n=1 Tax=Litoribacterium kuwaitense TaxID=1398745 RepID=UPI0013ECA8D5|nr:NAD(P)-dependent alcohol dehydrogenase [Litoribacterium kuwaitense]NGP46387.1 NAD(P)-dependent alcohol dehydrogenase [Litoribacterium kuwaitense]
MKAAVLTDLKTIDIQDIDLPAINDDEVLIQIRAVGLCGSDVHYYEHGKIGNFIVDKPLVLGHEASGDIVQVGNNVTGLKEGQRVSIEPGATCGTCRYCKEGRYNLCPHVEFLATPPYDGAFCEFISMRADLVFPIPDTMSYETAALIEPFSVGVHAIHRGRLQKGETVIIMGMGPIGLVTAAAAKMNGAKTVIGVDLEESRLEVAKDMGTDYTINLRQEDLQEKVKEYTSGAGVDLAIETAGNAKAVQGAIAVARAGGRVVIVGMSPQDEVPMSTSAIIDKELDVMGVFRYHHTYAPAIEMLSKTDIQIEKMITNYFPLSQTADAIEQSIQDKANTLKIIIQPDQ